MDWKIINLKKTEIHCKTGFFLTPASEKTKTQAQGGTFLILRETQEKKNSISPIFLYIRKKFHGVPLFMPFLLTNISNFYQFEAFLFTTRQKGLHKQLLSDCYHCIACFFLLLLLADLTG